MIELFFVTCLMSAPQTCQERSMTDLEQKGVMSCLMAAQPQLAQWSEEHPGHQVKRWSCRQARVTEAKA